MRAAAIRIPRFFCDLVRVAARRQPGAVFKLENSKADSMTTSNDTGQLKHTPLLAPKKNLQATSQPDWQSQGGFKHSLAFVC